MNDGLIPSYESYFGGSCLLPDLAADLAVTTTMHSALDSSDYQQKEVAGTPYQQIQQQNASRRFPHHPSTFSHQPYGVPGDATAQILNNGTQINCISSDNRNNHNNNNVNIVMSTCGPSSIVPVTPTAAFTQIPFVQIHTTDVQPRSAFNSSRYRRTTTAAGISSHEKMIKAEPIKSENAEGAKDRINATPTPPTAAALQPQQQHLGNIQSHPSSTQGTSSSLQNGKNMKFPSETVNLYLGLDPPNIDCVTNTVGSEISATSAPEDDLLTFPKIYKCQCCPFISLSESGLQRHFNTSHGNLSENSLSRITISCPGCENKFYALTSLEAHLRQDHLMTEEDVVELIHAIKKKFKISQNSTPLATNNVKCADQIESNDAPMNGTQRRSRIYLKNVECLREPNRDPIEQQDNLITESLFHFDNDDDCNTLVNIGSISMEDHDIIGMLTSEETIYHNNGNNNSSNDYLNKIDNNIVNESVTPPNLESNKTNTNPQPKQKISIKSVDVLCEPALVRRDYEMQTTFGDFMNISHDLNLHANSDNNSNSHSENNINNDGTEIVNADDGEQRNYTVTANRELLVNSQSNVGTAEFTQDYEKPRKPKIYIKNVDILKEPMTFTSAYNSTPNTLTSESSSNVMNFNFMPQRGNNCYLETVESVHTTVPTFNGGVGGVGAAGGGGGGVSCGMSQLPLGTISDQYLFDSGASSYLISSTAPSTENYVYGNETHAENLLIDTTRFTDMITPITTESTPPISTQTSSSSPSLSSTTIENVIESTNRNGDVPYPQRPSAHATSNSIPLNAQKQKIFIKNVDILKEPQFQEPRGLLHLRTVDELNLMNKKEVENLIAPNLEGHQANDTTIKENISENCQPELNTANGGSGGGGESLSANDYCNDRNDVIEQISSYECENFKINEFNTSNEWQDDYDLGEDIRDIITSTMASSSLQSSATAAQKFIHDLDTPQMSLISIPDLEIEELAGGGKGAQHNVVNSDIGGTDTTEVVTNAIEDNNTHFIFDCENTIMENDTQETPLTGNVDNTINNNHTNRISNTSGQTDNADKSGTTAQSPSSSEEVLKHESLNRETPCSEQIETVTPSQKMNSSNFDNIPPLTPMTPTSAYTISTTDVVAPIAATPVCGLPVPPLVPMLPSVQLLKTVTITQNASAVSTAVTTITGSTTTATPTATTAPAPTTTAPAERGRIYVSNNLLQTPSASSRVAMQPSSAAPLSNEVKHKTTRKASKTKKEQMKTVTPIAVTVMGGTSVRGRPFGANRTGISKQRKELWESEAGGGVYLKCTVAGCAFRFKKSTTIEYHIKCHSSDSSPHSVACPECKMPFTNWNSLHTHLWRSHQIDMELYSCQLCNFKTPIYSRLLNTHSKIHYDERNYKCDQCEKAFKNTKQLKNHRRWHRNHNKAKKTMWESSKEYESNYDNKTDDTAAMVVAEKAKEHNNVEQIKVSSSNMPNTTVSSATIASTAPTTTSLPKTARNFYRCKNCDAVFSHQKTLREHLCKNAAAAVQCEVCDRVLTSRSSLKLHMQSHEPSRRFKCNICDYASSDHNAFRRHRMTHESSNGKAKMYACAHCDYKSIQSVAYQKHVQQKHPQLADSIVYKCKICSYATINKTLYDAHNIKHENLNSNNEGLITDGPASSMPATETVANRLEENSSNNKSVSQQSTAAAAPVAALSKNKIKVKSHLLLTTPGVVDAMTEFNDLCIDAFTIPV